MKKISILFILLSALAVLIPTQATMAINQSDGATEIPLRFPPTVTSGKPVLRAPAFISISAVYDDVTDCVITTFIQNIGTVAITLTNETSGEISTTTVYSSLGTSTIQISGTSGTWLVQYVTANGTAYEGEFTIF